MSTMKRPTAQRDQIATLWDKVVGNGNRGMVDDVAEMKGDVQFIKGKLEGMGGVSRRTVTLRRIAETAVTVAIFAVVIGGIVLFLFGKISVDDFVRILEARGG